MVYFVDFLIELTWKEGSFFFGENLGSLFFRPPPPDPLPRGEGEMIFGGVVNIFLKC